MTTLQDFIYAYGNYEITSIEDLKNLIIVQPKNVWDLKEGNSCFELTSKGFIHEISFSEREWDSSKRNLGNIFLTKQEAEDENTKRELYIEVKKYSYEFTLQEWLKQEIKKYYPYYDFYNHCIAIGEDDKQKRSILYFKSPEDIDKAIKKVGKEDFIKYYLEVKA